MEVAAAGGQARGHTSGLYQLIVYQYDVMDRHIVNAIASIKDAIIVYKQLLQPTSRKVGHHFMAPSATAHS